MINKMICMEKDNIKIIINGGWDENPRELKALKRFFKRHYASLMKKNYSIETAIKKIRRKLAKQGKRVLDLNNDIKLSRYLLRVGIHFLNKKRFGLDKNLKESIKFFAETYTDDLNEVNFLAPNPEAEIVKAIINSEFNQNNSIFSVVPYLIIFRELWKQGFSIIPDEFLSPEFDAWSQSAWQGINSEFTLDNVEKTKGKLNIEKHFDLDKFFFKGLYPAHVFTSKFGHQAFNALKHLDLTNLSKILNTQYKREAKRIKDIYWQNFISYYILQTNFKQYRSEFIKIYEHIENNQTLEQGMIKSLEKMSQPFTYDKSDKLLDFIFKEYKQKLDLFKTIILNTNNFDKVFFIPFAPNTPMLIFEKGKHKKPSIIINPVASLKMASVKYSFFSENADILSIYFNSIIFTQLLQTGYKIDQLVDVPNSDHNSFVEFLYYNLTDNELFNRLNHQFASKEKDLDEKISMFFTIKNLFEEPDGIDPYIMYPNLYNELNLYDLDRSQRLTAEISLNCSADFRVYK